METNTNLPSLTFWAKNKKTIIAVVGILALLALLYFFVIKPKMDKKRLEEGAGDTDANEEKPKVNEMIGKKVFPKKENKFVEIRKSPEFKTDNIIGKIDFPNEAGRIMKMQLNKEDNKLWYKIRLTKAIGKANEGFVREDSITIQ